MRTILFLYLFCFSIVCQANRLQSIDSRIQIQEPMPERQSYLDNFKGESFNSEENDINDRRNSDDSRASSNILLHLI